MLLCSPADGSAYRRTRQLLILPGVILALMLPPEKRARAGDSWFVVRFDGKPVGYEHLTVGAVSDSNPPMQSCVRKTRLRFKRLGKNLTLDAMLSTQQTAEGLLHSFDLNRIDAAGGRVERSGIWDPARRAYRIEERVTATRRKFDLRVSKQAYSPVMEAWLPHVQFSVSGRLTRSVLFPETSVVTQVTANQKRNRKIQLADYRGQRDVRQINFYPVLDPIKSTTLSISDIGEVLLQERSLMGGKLTFEKSSPEGALAAVADGSVDLDAASIIPVDRLISIAPGIHKTRLQIEVDSGILRDIPQTAFQQVTRISTSAIQLNLVSPEIPRRRFASTQQNTLLQSESPWMPLNDTQLQKIAAIASAGQTEPAEVCRRLEAWVHAKLNNSAFSTGLVPADKVARTMRGDCTEHAVLLAALLRIRGIPSRVAAGLVYSSARYGFTGHAWVEARVGDSWIPLDSALGRDAIGRPHIKLSDSDLIGESANGSVLFLPVLELAGRAKIKMIDQR